MSPDSGVGQGGVEPSIHPLQKLLSPRASFIDPWTQLPGAHPSQSPSLRICPLVLCSVCTWGWRYVIRIISQPSVIGWMSSVCRIQQRCRCFPPMFSRLPSLEEKLCAGSATERVGAVFFQREANPVAEKTNLRFLKNLAGILFENITARSSSSCWICLATERNNCVLRGWRRRWGRHAIRCRRCSRF